MADAYTVKLPRLPVNWQQTPALVERYWDEAMVKIERTLNAILEIPEIQEALQDIDTAVQNAQNAADNANAAAANAQAATDAQASETSLVNSYVNDFTPPLLTSDSAGVITIANHDRVYGDTSLNPTVAVNGDTLNTMATSGQIVRIYYDDPSRSGGSVTYQWTIDPNPPPVQTGNRHSVGAVEVPATGTVDGNYIRPPGYVGPIP